MNEFPRTKLCEVIKSLGLTSERLSTDPKLIKGLLLDLCGQHRREINVLVLALAEGFVEKLTKSQDGSPQIRVATAARRFCEEFALTEDAATWGINSWAIALAIVDSPVPVFAPSPPIKQTPAITTQAKMNIPAVALVSIPGIPNIVDPSKPVAVVSRLGLGQYKTIGDAIKAVDSGSMIVVKQGTYEESISSGGKRLHIHADDSSGPVIIHDRFSTNFYPHGDLIVSGFTLQDQVRVDDGTIYFVNCVFGEIKFESRDARRGSNTHFQDCRVGKIEFKSSSYLDIEQRLTMERCEISKHGVGVSISGKTALAKLIDCKLHSCSTAVAFDQKSKGLVYGCVISSCSSAAIRIDNDSSVSFDECRIQNNGSGAILVKGYGLVKVENCQINNNQGVAFSVESGNIELCRCLVNGNLKAASFEAESAGTITDCDLRNNSMPVTISAGAQVHQSNNIV